MPRYILSYDICKKEDLDRNLRDDEIQEMRLVRQNFKNTIEQVFGDPFLITTYIFTKKDFDLENLRIEFIKQFEEIVRDINIRLLKKFEIKVMICKLARNSQLIYPDGNLDVI